MEHTSPLVPPKDHVYCLRLLGQSPMARDFDSQVAEIEIRVAVLNRNTDFGIPVAEPAG